MRQRRSVAVQIDGKWQDAGTILVREGHVLPHANGIEVAWNNTYRRLAQQAVAAGRNLYDRDYCGAGPRQADVDRHVTLYANWDAEGHDGSNLNGEWVRLRNASDTAIGIGGWWLRDSHTRNEGAHGFTFPSWAKIPAHGAITLHVGRGTSTATRYYIGESNSIFDNVSRDARGLGDGAYLFDPDGDLRKWQSYACLSGCHDPLKGRINIKADPTGEESIAIRNTSTTNLNLDGHLIVNFPYSYPFTRRTIVKPGETLRLFVTKRGKDTRLVRHWNKPKNILNDGGDAVSVRTFDDQMSDCHAWGGSGC